MSFKENKYLIIRNTISNELADFVYKYFLLKKKVARIFFEKKYISPFATEWGVWNDPQAPETYSHYGDIAMETLLTEVKPVMEEKTGLKLIETYSYARIYKKGDILKRHKDRNECEISTTMFLGGDQWDIYLEPNKNVGYHPEGPYVQSTNKGINVTLNQGDMLIYSGCELEHWREAFQGTNCCQVFLHYNNSTSPEAEKNKYDTRVSLGMPGDTKNKN